MAEVGVITTALRNEANKWRDLSDQMAPIKSAVDGLGLDLSAFFIGDLNAGLHKAYYDDYRSFMSRILSQGVVEFEQVADALVKIADEYDKADAVTELDLNKIYSA
jgi:hypothetical protein